MTTQPKFEVGKYYRRRDGSVRRLVNVLPQAIFSLVDDAGASYTDNGRYIGDHLQHEKDLVEEVLVSAGSTPTDNPADAYLRALSLHLTPEAEHTRKRFELAKAAMQGDLVNAELDRDEDFRERAHLYFRMADAMLEVEKEGSV